MGNHELLNIAGDVSYVSDAAFAEFAAETDEDDSSVPEMTPGAFDEYYPPGFFSYLEAFSPDGEYGKWLLEQAWVVVVNDTAFLHGGLSSLPLGTEQATSDLARYGNLWRELSGSGLVELRIGFFDHLDSLERLEGSKALSAEQQVVVDELLILEQAPIFQSNSLAWYRGNAACAAVLELDGFNAHLENLGARRAVLGHTPTASHHVQSRLDNRVVLLDTGMLASRYYGQPSMLSIDDDELRVIYADEAEWQEVEAEVRDVGYRRGGVSDTQLEAWMQSAPVLRTRKGNDKSHQLLTLGDDEEEISAHWYPLKAAGADRAVAAYRLDSLLGLELIPVTVRREINGKQGVVQYVAEGAVTEEERASKGLPGAFLCDLGRQYDLMYVLDILLYNEGRTPATIAYDPVTTRLILVNNSKTFSRKSGAPPHLKGRKLAMPEELAHRLSELSSDSLNQSLAELLSKREIAALLKRRDYVLNSAK
jgi:hypothetical protein